MTRTPLLAGSAPVLPRMAKIGTGVKLIAHPGMVFGYGTVIVPELRVPKAGSGSRKPTVIRCARLQCKCNTVYTAGLSELFRGKIQSCGCLARNRKRPGPKKVYVQRNKGGFALVAYLGWVKTREEAEEYVSRLRVTVLPRMS